MRRAPLSRSETTTSARPSKCTERASPREAVVSPGPWSDAAAARFSRAERIRLQPAERASGTADIDAKLMRPIARSRYALPFRGPHDAIGPADDDRPAQQTGRGGCGRGGARHQGEEGDEPPSRHADRDRWDPG